MNIYQCRVTVRFSWALPSILLLMHSLMNRIQVRLKQTSIRPGYGSSFEKRRIRPEGELSSPKKGKSGLEGESCSLKQQEISDIIEPSNLHHPTVRLASSP